MDTDKNVLCSFCGMSEKETRVIITGKTGHICELCAEKVVDLARAEVAYQKGQGKGKVAGRDEEIDWSILKPADLKAYLDKYVVGQSRAKEVLSVAVYNHYKRLEQESKVGMDKEMGVKSRGEEVGKREVAREESDRVEIEKSNVLLLGPSGVGKTLLVRTIARKVGVPCVIADATTLTQEGYVGQDPDSVVRKAYHAAGHDVKAAERSIIFIDEFDKLRAKGENTSITRDVGGEGVQEALLKILEGTTVNIPPHGGRKHPEQKLIPISTHNILFICGGAFVGLDTITESRLRKQNIGFQLDGTAYKEVDKEEVLRYVSSKDLRTYGLIPEIIGRLPAIVALGRLDTKMLRRVLTEPRNALLKQYKELFRMEGVDLIFEDAALDYIAQKALDYDMGARSLRGLMETILMDAMFHYPSAQDKKKLIVDKNYVTNQLHKERKIA